MNYPKIFDVVEKENSENIYGLKFRPTIKNSEHRENEDCFYEIFPPFSRNPGDTTHEGFSEYTGCNFRMLENTLNSVKDIIRCIVEIGVDRSPNELTYSQILMMKKRLETIYLGVDIDDRSRLNNPEQNIYTVQTDSAAHEKVYAKMNQLGIDEIDFLFIDGYHSIYQAIEDWKYVERLSEHGLVVMHDVRAHPGPYAVFEAIDESMFYKEKFCCNNEGDHGIGVVRRKEGAET